MTRSASDGVGYTMPSPSPEAMISWPTGWGSRFTLTVDTEEEFDWRAAPSRAARSTTATAALPAAHRRFAGAGVPVTYMVDHPVATDARAIASVAEVLAHGGADVGTQLHPWVNPPFSPGHDEVTYPGLLPRPDEAAKLDVLTQAIETAFDRRPVAYRAGRYGIGTSTLELLADRGYRLDSSVRSGYDYRAAGGPDFRAIGADPFRAGPGGRIIELPLTTVFIGRWQSRGARWYERAGRLPHGRGVLARAGLLSRVALTPEDMPIAEAIKAVRIAVEQRVPVLNFAFHSPSLVPGHTPYVRTDADLVRFWRWWDLMLNELARLGVIAASLDQVIAAAG